MKFRHLFTTSLVGLLFVAGPASAATKEPVTLKSKQDKLSYTIGVDMGTNFKSQGIDIDPTILSKGLEDGLTGQPSLLPEKEMEEVLMSLQKEMVAKRDQEFKTLSKKNAEEGKQFLAQNSKKPGVVTLPSGLQYQIIKAGSGTPPNSSDTVTVEYRGTLINGTVFDQTEKNKPVSFKVSEVIPGWTEALTKMKPGAEWEVYIPSKLAYGENGVGGPIGPNQTLVFKIHLISVNNSNTKKA